ncbi:MAG: hypothetical protein HC927_09100 [Deltaproteobacteria bacterium]|nr:hypothetical protein [Deltaproteobacteria bacterium]
MRCRIALLVLVVLGCTAESTTADEVGETTTDELETTDDGADPCGEAQCDFGNPCQTVTCCGPTDPDCQPIFHDVQIASGWMLANNGCTIGCHGAAVPTGGLSLVAEDDPWCSLVNRPSSGPSRLSLVEPGQPTQSYLWHKLQGTHACLRVGGDGSAMPPPTSCPLAVSNPIFSELVTAWICCGAPKSPEDPLGESCF